MANCECRKLSGFFGAISCLFFKLLTAILKIEDQIFIYTKITLDNLFKDCKEALDAGNCTLAFSFLEKAYPLLLNYPLKNIVWAKYYFNYAIVHNNAGDFVKSRKYARQASEIAQYNKNEYLDARVESIIATTFLNTGNFQESLKHANLALKSFNKLNKSQEKADILIDLGKICLRQGDWKDAIKKYSEALFIAKKIKKRKIEGEALMSLGYIFRGHRFLYLAIDHYREVEKIYKSINYTQGVVMAMYERANTYLSLEKSDIANKLKVEIETLTPPDSTMRVFLLKLQYCIHNHNRDFSSAMICANQLLSFFQKAQARIDEAECYEMIASCYYNISDMEKAQHFCEIGLKISEDIGGQIFISVYKEFIDQIAIIKNNNINLGELRNQ